MLMKSSRGRAESGMASLACGSCTGSERSSSSRPAATRKKINSRKTMWITGVMFNAPSGLLCLIFTAIANS